MNNKNTYKDVVGWDGEMFFCQLCGKTYPKKMAVLGHQKNCPKRMLKNVKVVSIPQESRDWLNSHSVDAQQRNYVAQCVAKRVAPVAQCVASPVAQQQRNNENITRLSPNIPIFPTQLNNENITRLSPNIPIFPTQLNNENITRLSPKECQHYEVADVQTGEELYQASNMLKRVYALEQSQNNLAHYVYNDVTHQNAVAIQQNWRESIPWWVWFLLGVGGGIIFDKLFDSPKSQENPSGAGEIGKKLLNRAVDRGASKIIDRIF